MSAWIWSSWWEIKRHIKSIVCFFVGHRISYGSRYMGDIDWCTRCHFNADERNLEDGLTVPRILNQLYRWLVEHEWYWFDRFDLWLLKSKYNKYLPTWWEY